MHYHCEVWVPDKNDYYSQVIKTLDGLHEEDDGFYDWWVVGGRWSGEHTLWRLKAKYGGRKINKLYDEFEKKYGWWINKETNEDKRRKQFEEVFFSHIPKEEYKELVPSGIVPSWRNHYDMKGYDDDIIAVVDIPWKFFTCYTFVLSEFKKMERKFYHQENWNGSTFQDSEFKVKDILDNEGLTNFGYLVTVDYHS
jgi:hypothetical protein